jgi:hypothetical protein
MSTEQLNTDGGAPSAPPPSVMDEDAYAALSPEERRRERMGEREPEPAPAPKTNGHDTSSDALKADDDGEPGEIRIEENGTVRDRKTGRFVPYEAYGKVREKAKATEAELTALRETHAKAEGRYSELSSIIGLLTKDEKPAQSNAEPAKPIDPREDVIGAVQYLLEQFPQVQKALEETKGGLTQRDENARILSAYEQDIGSTLKEHADFGDAYAHLVRVKDRELEVRGIADPERRKQLLQGAEREIVTKALKEGRSAAKELYALAEVYGYTKKAAAPANGKSEAEAKIEHIRGGMQAGASLSPAGGSSGEGISEGNLAKMSEDEYASLRSKLSKTEFRKLMGG